MRFARVITLLAELFDVIIHSNQQHASKLLHGLVQVVDHYQTSFMLCMVTLRIASTTLTDNVSMMAYTLSVLSVPVVDAFQSSLAVMVLQVLCSLSSSQAEML